MMDEDTDAMVALAMEAPRCFGPLAFLEAPERQMKLPWGGGGMERDLACLQDWLTALRIQITNASPHHKRSYGLT